jgi:protein-S-isoprenylcysteine O-methyltransferase Ste14
MKVSRFKSRRFKSFYVWLVVGVFFYLVDCLVATSVDKTTFDLPWFERGIYAGGPFGILLTVVWLVFPIGRRIFKRVRMRPRD